MGWLPDGEKISKISLFVLAQLTNVTDGQTPGDGNSRAMHSIARQKSDIKPDDMSRDQKLKFLKLKMATAAILKITFGHNHQPIVRFQRNFVRESETACRQRPRDKNCKFLKSKMADGRQITISQ